MFVLRFYLEVVGWCCIVYVLCFVCRVGVGLFRLILFRVKVGMVGLFLIFGISFVYFSVFMMEFWKVGGIALFVNRI